MNDPDEYDDNREKQRIEEFNQKLRKRHVNDLQKILSFVEGRRFLWDLFYRFPPFLDPFPYPAPNANPGDRAIDLAHNVGRQLISNNIYQEIWVNFPQTLMQMKREHDSDLRSAAAEFRKHERRD